MVKVIMLEEKLPPKTRGRSYASIRNEKDIYGRIISIEYDPNRNAYICRIHHGDGENT